MTADKSLLFSTSHKLFVPILNHAFFLSRSFDGFTLFFFGNVVVHNLFQMEKFQLAQEREEMLGLQSSRYEERLVELHSVIAELSKQCEEAKAAAGRYFFLILPMYIAITLLF